MGEMWTAGVDESGRTETETVQRYGFRELSSVADLPGSTTPVKITTRILAIPTPVRTYFASIRTLAEWLLNSGAYIHCTFTNPLG